LGKAEETTFALSKEVLAYPPTVCSVRREGGVSDVAFLNGLFLWLTAYLLGSVCTGYYLVRVVSGKDVRQYGSGSVGASNVRRMIGWPGFLLTFLGDCSKGALTVFLAYRLECPPLALAGSMIAVVAGHVWPILLHFRGGKGVATALGVVFLMDIRLPLLLLPVLGLSLCLFRRWIFSGLVTIILALPMALFLHWTGSYVLGLGGMILLILWAHRTNLRPG
jgi:acyl phosphate:glycerol-3-phosphate acyltransferase